MAERDLQADLYEPVLLRWSQFREGDPKHSRRPNEQRRLTRRVARSTSSNRCVAAGSRCTRPLKLDSVRAGSDSWPPRPNPPASTPGDDSRGSSSRASGLPRVSATIRSRTRSSSGPRMTEASSSRAAASGNPGIRRREVPPAPRGRWLRALRTGAPPTRPPAAEPRMPAPVPRTGRATGRHRPGRPTVAAPQPRRANRGLRARSEIDRAARPELQAERDHERLVLRTRQSFAIAEQPRAELVQTGEGGLPSPTRPRLRVGPDSPWRSLPRTAAGRTLPTPGSPRSTRTPLRPSRASASS